MAVMVRCRACDEYSFANDPEHFVCSNCLTRIDEPLDPPEPGASDRQVGGNHYKDMPIQPSTFIYENGLNWYEGNAIKYICRHAKKNGALDIDKAIHYLELLKEQEYGD